MAMLDEAQTRRLIEALDSADLAALKEVQLATRRRPRVALLIIALAQLGEGDQPLAAELLRDLEKRTGVAAAAAEKALKILIDLNRRDGPY